MPQFFLSCLAAALATFGGREAIRAARLGGAMGRGGALTLAIVISVAASSAIAAWIGSELAPLLTLAGQTMVAGGALLFAAAEVWLLRAGPAPREPTRSFFAVLLVLTAALSTDAARFLILAIALASGDCWLTAAGGALGSGAVLLMARWGGAEWERRLPIAALRKTVAALLLCTAILIGLSAWSVPS